MVEPGFTSCAAARAIATLALLLRRRRASKVGSEASKISTWPSRIVMAPPWVRFSALRSSNSTRSRRAVISETPVASATSRTVRKPRLASSSRMRV
jgi:hypothetical protein